MEKEFYEEFEDMEAGIDQKQALVEESKKLMKLKISTKSFRFVNDLKKNGERLDLGSLWQKKS